MSTTHRGLDVTTLHHHNHRNSLATGNGVVHDVLHVSLLAPAGLILTHTMLQIEHRVALLDVLLGIIASGGIDHGVAPCLLLITEVVDAAHLSVLNTLLWTIVVTFWSFRNLEATSLTVTAEEGLCSRIDEVHTTDIHEIIVEALHQRISNSHPATFAIRLHVVFLVADIQHYLLCIRSTQVEIAATLRVDLREVVTGNGGLGNLCIGRNNDFLAWHLRTLGFEAQETGNGLAIAAAQLTIACSIEVQTVRTVRAVV